ncbi:MAG TPA: sulfurtransferase, partial [Nitrospirae bacterium]|nr:sulfurtransferase [Nitrospirota bacterium]
MSLLDLFKSAPTISPDTVREYITGKKPDEYLLLDVRQPSEYEHGHLPGARLMPISELSSRLGELDTQKQTILYCRSGNRSNSAAGLLIGAGFKDVLNMQGGITRYSGIVASGPPEAGLFCFPETLTPGELSAVAWYLEDSTIRFLNSLRADVLSDKTPDIVYKLVEEKEVHKQKLAKLYKELTGKEPEPEFPKGVL